MLKTVTATVFGLSVILTPTAFAAPAQAPFDAATYYAIAGAFPAADEAPKTITATKKAKPSAPVAVHIPSIGLDAPVVRMGLLKNGELAVPSGSTQNVGWYAKGTVPGARGSAVLDAHVYAAFSNLHNVQVGDSIYVTGENGHVQRFVVEDTEVFKLGDLRPNYLFNRKDKKRLTLITCAGEDLGNTYSHRLVVSATLAQ